MTDTNSADTTNLPDLIPQLEDAVTIEALQLEEEFVKLPAALARWNHLYARSTTAVAKAKIALTRLEAELDKRFRMELDLDPTIKRVTEAMVESAIHTSDEWYAGKMAVVEAEAEKAMYAGACEAIRGKRDMLIQLGAHLRAEMERDPSIREEQRASRMMNEG